MRGNKNDRDPEIFPDPSCRLDPVHPFPKVDVQEDEVGLPLDNHFQGFLTGLGLAADIIPELGEPPLGYF